MTSNSSIKSPEEFTAYQHERVVDRFMKVHKTSKEEAETIFRELMKFLYVTAHIPASSPPSATVDEMWHTFLMFTADYFNFCAEYAGRFLHHQPTDKPHIGNRPELLALANSTFGKLDDTYWYHVTKTKPNTLRACSNNYCSESCDNNQHIDIEKMRPYMTDGSEPTSAINA